MCVNGWESEDSFSVNSYESEYPKNDESGNIYESGKISSSVNLVQECLSSKQGYYGKFSQFISIPLMIGYSSGISTVFLKTKH